VNVTLSSGQTLTVKPVPPFVLTDAHHALSTLSDSEKDRALRGVALLCALPEIKVPDDWKFPRGLTYAGAVPRAGVDGRLLDYIEYGLLVTPADIAAVQAVMYGADVTEPEVTAAEATFQPDGGRAAYPAHTEG